MLWRSKLVFNRRENCYYRDCYPIQCVYPHNTQKHTHTHTHTLIYTFLGPDDDCMEMVSGRQTQLKHTHTSRSSSRHQTHTNTHSQTSPGKCEKKHKANIHANKIKIECIMLSSRARVIDWEGKSFFFCTHTLTHTDTHINTSREIESDRHGERESVYFHWQEHYNYTKINTYRYI